MTLREAAQRVKGVAEDGIGWIALWRTGKSWHSWVCWPDFDERGGILSFHDNDEVDRLREIAQEDPSAILVNSWVHNLAVTDYFVSVARLAEALRWQYSEQFYLVADAI